MLHYHQLNIAHVHSLDSADERIIDKSNEFSGVVLSFSDDTFRKVFFFTHDQMQETIQKLLELQGFDDRMDQYERICELPDGFACTRSMVRHKLTGKQYEMRSLDTINVDEESLGVFEFEMKARLMATDSKHVDTLVDAFRAQNFLTMILKLRGGA